MQHVSFRQGGAITGEELPALLGIAALKWWVRDGSTRIDTRTTARGLAEVGPPDVVIILRVDSS